MLIFAGALAFGIWLYLALARGGFWKADQRLPRTAAQARRRWPSVVAIVPARNEAAVLSTTLPSLLSQVYRGAYRVVLVDDNSSDGTAEVARRIMRTTSSAHLVHPARALPPGWAGKVWALAQGVEAASEIMPDAEYIWLTDADIRHQPHHLARLVAKAEDADLDLVSVMAELSVQGGWTRLLIPPFVYFFQLLYPFPWVNDSTRVCAAAAGGCILIRRPVLERIGGLATIRDALIDDCALARLVKRNGRDGGGRIWLGLADGAWSVRDYEGLSGIWQMVARTAFAELRYSWLRLGAALVIMGTVYIAPPLLTLLYPWHGRIAGAGLGLVAWILMSWTYCPTLQLYRQPILLAPLLPVAAPIYMAMTIDSALRYLGGRGGFWKGRTQAGGRHPSSVSGNPLPGHWFDHHPPSI